MKITRQLKITENEFYDYLESTLLSDISQCTKKKYTPQDIKKGMKYSKYTQDVNARADMTIQKYKRGEIYEVKIKTFSDSIIITYLTKITDEGLQVTFKEHIQSYESQKYRHMTRLFYELVYLRRMNATLDDIEKKIIALRDGQPFKQSAPQTEHKLLYKILSQNKM